MYEQTEITIEVNPLAFPFVLLFLRGNMHGTAKKNGKEENKTQVELNKKKKTNQG